MGLHEGTCLARTVQGRAQRCALAVPHPSCAWLRRWPAAARQPGCDALVHRVTTKGLQQVRRCGHKRESGTSVRNRTSGVLACAAMQLGSGTRTCGGSEDPGQNNGTQTSRRNTRSRTDSEQRKQCDHNMHSGRNLSALVLGPTSLSACGRARLWTRRQVCLHGFRWRRTTFLQLASGQKSHRMIQVDSVH